MKALHLLGLLAFLYSCSSENVDDLQPESSEEENPGTFLEAIQEQSRTCVPRDGDCTENRKGCCRSKIFQDRCQCRKVSQDKVACSCKQPYWLMKIEEIIGDIPEKPKPVEGKCVKKHHDCSQRKNDCCPGSMENYTCKCYNTLEEGAKESEICGCVSKADHQILAQGFRYVKRLHDLR
uniref:CpTx-3d toxin n=1 Tax=Cheiracanthium punctorium TaxID=682790 RepID=A0A059T2H6_CHEPU|nr:CpTx-3d toxin precursor [Cheiracanthium punctorium]